MRVSVNRKTIYVYENFDSAEPNYLGTLFVENVRGRESYSFEYDEQWLKNSTHYLHLDPDLQLYAGRQYPSGGKNVFGLFADSSPDRWGRLLMTRRERILADQEGRKPRELLDSDFLMGVYDETRMGAIRFKQDKDGPFLSDDSKTPTPPWTSLRTLEEASRQFENDESGVEQKWVDQLIKPGSSLGGLGLRQPSLMQKEIYGSPSSHPNMMMLMLVLGKRSPMILQSCVVLMSLNP